MARGYLYNAGKVELEPGLMDALADLKTNESTEVSEDFSNVMSGIAEDIRSCMTADYVIEKILNEAEYLVDINDWQDDFSDMINKYGGEAFVFEDNVIFRINQTAIENCFKVQFETFKKLVGETTLRDFASDDVAWDLQNAVSTRWNDAMFLDGDFHLFDDGIRRLERDTWYIVTNAMLMH